MGPGRFSVAALLFVIFILSSSCLVLGVEDTSCLQRLVPCIPYVEATGTPPPECCSPLAEAIVEQRKCLCALFDDQDFLKSFNVTQKTVLQLPRRCGIPVDDNICQAFLGKAPAPALAPSTPPSAGNSPNVPVSQPAAPGGANHVEASCFVAFIVALLISIAPLA